jgi:signal transduction histidine kinase
MGAIEVNLKMLLTREELQERLIALHQASLELVKDVSLETLLKRIATVACEQVDARYAAVGVLDDSGALKQFISVGMSEEEIRRMPHPPTGLGLIGALMDRDEPIRLADISHDPRSVGFPPHHPKMRSFLGVPILAADRQLGQIYLTEKANQADFSADDERIIQMLAAYASAAIQNARIYQHLRERDVALTRRTEDSAFLNDIASTLTSSLQIDEILNKTLATVMNYLKVEAGEIFLLEEDKQTLKMVLHRGQAAEAFWNRSKFQVGEGHPGLVARTGEPIVSGDLASDTRFLRQAIIDAGFHQIACLPLKASGNLVGVLNVASRGTTPFDLQDIQLLTAVCNWAGMAIENARLHQNARRLAVLEERERIGMDLHDGIIQSIYGVGLAMENISHLLGDDSSQVKNRLKHVIEDLNQVIRDIRAYILDLRPRQMNNENLLDGLKRLVSEYRANTLALATVNGAKARLDSLPQSHSTALFHICQEALANVAKHGAAKRVSVNVWTTDERVVMEIRDNGKGFDPEQINKSIGHGLANMQTRARAVGGELDISSVPGEGTTILAWVPRRAE